MNMLIDGLNSSKYDLNFSHKKPTSTKRNTLEFVSGNERNSSVGKLAWMGSLIKVGSR